MYDETYDFDQLALDHERQKALYRRHRAGKIRSKEKQIKAKPNRNILRRMETLETIPAPHPTCAYIRLERNRILNFVFEVGKNTNISLNRGPLVEIKPYPEIDRVLYRIYEYRYFITFLDQNMHPIILVQTKEDICSQKGTGTFPKDFLEPLFLEYFNKTPDQVLNGNYFKGPEIVTVEPKYRDAYTRYLKVYKSSRWYDKLDLVTKRRILDRHVLSQAHSASLLDLDDRLDDALHSLPIKDKMDYHY